MANKLFLHLISYIGMIIVQIIEFETTKNVLLPYIRFQIIINNKYRSNCRD